MVATGNSSHSLTPTIRRRGPYKRKKGGGSRGTFNKHNKKVENLAEFLNPIPFIPKALDLHKHEDVLKKVGLYEFSKIELDRSIRTDLLAQLIVNYDSKKRYSYVNGKRVYVNRADLARALKLPAAKQDKGGSRRVEIDLDSELFSDEEIGFIEDFVFNWVLLHDEAWDTPKDIENWTSCIRNGHPEKLDSASLVWYKVEKELSQGVKLVDCYYASHLQYLIKSQHCQLFEEDGGSGGEECEEKVYVVLEDDVEESLGTNDVEIVHREVTKDDEAMVGVEECKGEEEVKEMEEQMKCENILFDGGDVDKEHKEKVSNVQGDDVELTLGPEFEEIVHQNVMKDDETTADVEKDDETTVVVEKDDETTVVVEKDDETTVHVEKCMEEELKEIGGEQVNWKKVSGDGGGVDEEHEEEVSNGQENDVELTLGPDVEEIVHQEVRKDDETMVNVEECKEEVKEMEEQVNRKDLLGDGGDVDEEREEKLSNVQEDDVELTLGPAEEIGHQEVRKDDETMAEAEECKKDEAVEEMEDQVKWKNVSGEHFLQHCQSSDLNDYEEFKVVEEVEDEQIEQVEVEDEQVEQVEVEDEQIEQVEVEDEQIEQVEVEDEQIEQVEVEDEQIEQVEVEDEQIEQVEVEDDEVEVEVEEEGGSERFVEGFDMEANDDLMVRDGLTDNFLQGVETSHIAYGSNGVSSMDIFRSRDDLFMSHAGPSFFNNGGKRVMEPGEDMHHHGGNNKRLKTDETWDQKQNDFGYVMVQMQQWMEKAKMIHDSELESYVNSKNYQDAAMDELQQRHQLMEMIIKSKDDELEKKNDEVFRLEREVYLMGDLLAGYRKALNDTRFKFSEYRKRFTLQEEPLYKDAGPGGLVLSTRELEKQRLKQEQEIMKLQTLLNSFEEECVYQLEIQGERALKMAEKLVFVENEVKILKEVAARRKETQKPRDELELTTEPEEKSHNEILENDANASMKSVPLDADETKEKGGEEEH